MLIYGAGGHARVILSMLLARNTPVHAIFDDDPFKKECCEVRVMSPYNCELFPDEEIIVAIGDNYNRRVLVEKVKHKFGHFIHSSAFVAGTMQLGIGTVVFQNAVIQTSTRIGTHVIINTAAILEHDCILENFVHIGPGSTLCGNVSIGENTLIGAGTVVIPGISIGKNCVVGAGSVVIRDIADGNVVCGNPGRVIRC